jgi:hypothetical protein
VSQPKTIATAHHSMTILFRNRVREFCHPPPCDSSIIFSLYRGIEKPRRLLKRWRGAIGGLWHNSALPIPTGMLAGALVSAERPPITDQVSPVDGGRSGSGLGSRERVAGRPKEAPLVRQRPVEIPGRYGSAPMFVSDSGTGSAGSTSGLPPCRPLLWLRRLCTRGCPHTVGAAARQGRAGTARSGNVVREAGVVDTPGREFRRRRQTGLGRHIVVPLRQRGRHLAVAKPLALGPE